MCVCVCGVFSVCAYDCCVCLCVGVMSLSVVLWCVSLVCEIVVV